MNCPYPILSDQDDSVNMIGHHDGRVQLDSRKSYVYRFPNGLNQVTGLVQLHLSVDNLAEEESLLVRADGDEICARL